MAQPGAVSGPRRLLRRLRDVMAGPASAQDRLDKIVRIIAGDMVAEVCSCYVMRAGEVLELFATEGLNPTAVHRTRLRVGEGLVGDIAAFARPLMLADAQAHPKFAYRPETGEEIFRSLMGVPVLRAGRVLGVLVVQNRTRRNYTEEEVEALQIIAMVLAEMISSGDLVDPEELAEVDNPAWTRGRLEGQRLVGGMAIGHVVLHQPNVRISTMVAEDPAKERERLRSALSGLQDAVDRILAEPDFEGGEHRDVLETYRMFARDTGWLKRIEEVINSGLTAEAAVMRVQEDTRMRMSQIVEPYLRERLLDLDDLTLRLLKHLAGVSAPDPSTLPDEIVLVARSLGPAELLDFDRSRLKAVVLEEGTHTAHVAIVARAFDLPVVGRVRGALSRIRSGALVIVDADLGAVFLQPGEDLIQTTRTAIEAGQTRRAAYAAMRDLPAITRDGRRVSLRINAGLLIDMANLEATGADGVGLYRTEIPFMIHAQFPDLQAQTDLYARVFESAKDRPVVFRTLDLGADKRLPYFPVSEEENPALGWRSIRIGLDRPALLRQQLRALLQAAAGRPFSIMFPMIADVADLDGARDLLDRELARAKELGQPVGDLRVGAMIEVPALIWQLDQLLPQVDFVSVGSNDLMQFFFASDRNNPRLAERYDLLSSAALNMMRALVEATDKAGVTLSVCGEAAGRPLEAMTLVALGVRELSMPPGGVGPVREMIRSLDAEALAHYLDSLRGAPDHSLRHKLRSFAQDHNISL